MAGPTVEEQVVLDADPRALNAAMAAIENKIKTIGGMVTKIVRDAEAGGKAFDNTLIQTLRQYQKAQGALSTLANASNTPSGRIQDLNGNRALARQTIQATEYARELNVARNAVEALQAKINNLNKAAAAGGTITTKQRDQLNNYQQQLTVLKQLDKQFSAMTDKARRMSGVDLSAEIKAVADARDRVAKAALSGRRVNIGTELNGLSDAQAALADRIAAARRAETQALRTSLQARKELAIADVSNLKEVDALERARTNNARKMAEIRAELRTANAAERVGLLENLQIEKARGAQIRSNLSEAQRLARAEGGGGAGGGSAPGRTGIAKYLPAGGLAAVGVRTLAYGGIAGAAFGAVNTVTEGVGFGIQFEDELAKLQAIANATTSQMQTLKASILDVGTSSRFSVIDLTKISQTLAQAGVSAGEMKTVLEAVTTLATASGSTPDEAVNLVTGALGAFQLQASETARVADLMTSALNRTKLTVQQVGQAIQYVGATAFEQNVTLEDLLATVGAMAQAGIKSGSTIGTGLRQLLVDLADPSKKLVEQLKAVGLTAADVNVSVHGEAQVLETLKTAGFGAGQAYAGLETRAAAAYLVLKNNVDVMDQLKLSFAEQGAAATANERAMDSLTAQWQRFKNILADGFSDDLDGLLVRAKDFLRWVNDTMSQKKGADAFSFSVSDPIGTGYGSDRYKNNWGEIGRFFAYENENLLPDTLKSIYKIQNAALDLMTPRFWIGGEGMGQALDRYNKNLGQTHDSMEKLQTKLTGFNEKADKQRGLISEVDKEMSRLSVQHGSLEGHTTRTTAETVTLMSKFEGLSKYLVGVTGDYGSLMNAMRQYRAEASGTMQTILSGQISAQGQVASAALAAGRGVRSRIFGNSALMSQLRPNERAALQQPRDPANARIIAEAGERLNNNDLRELSKQLGINAQALGEQRVATSQLNATMTQNTAAGQSLTDRTAKAEAGLAELAGLNGKARTSKANEARESARAVVAEVDRRLARGGPNDPAVAQLNEWKSRAQAVVTGVAAALAPTKDEIKEANKVEKQPKITQADIDGLGKALGLAMGRGHDDSPAARARQDAMHRRGLTPATGNTSGHTAPGGVARDFRTGPISNEQGARLEAAAKKYFADNGITGLFIQYENGKGKGQGTGPHLHVSARRNARRTGPASDGGDALAIQDALNQSQTQIDQRTYSTALKNIKGTATQELFQSTVTAAQTALDKLSADLMRDALNDLAKQGIVNDADPRFQERMTQVKEAIAQNKEQFQQAVADGLIKSTERQIKAAQTAFDLSMKPFDDRLAAAQGSVAGLGLYSNRFTPDYVTQLAQSRVSQAQEAQVRARAASLPTLISNDEGTLASLQSQMASGFGKDGTPLEGNALETVRQKVQELTKSIADLRTEKSNLDAQLGASGLVPTTFSDGLTQAIENFRQAHNLTQTFKQDVIDNLGGAIDMVASSLTDMFTGILTGTQSAIGAFANFAKSIIRYIQEMVAKIIASKILGMLINLVGSWVGSNVGPSTSTTVPGNPEGSSSFFDFGSLGSFNGGPAGAPIGRLQGGIVANGSEARDSVQTRLAKGEWVIRKKAVDSVGNDFMAQLNAHGAGALKAMQTVPALPKPAHQETNVWVVKPDQLPQPGPRDFIVAVQEDILSGGETAKLIKHVSHGG